MCDGFPGATEGSLCPARGVTHSVQPEDLHSAGASTRRSGTSRDGFAGGDGNIV